MKLKVFTLLALSWCVFLPSMADATSGACSYHGGVNCSAGSDYDGSVICKDGWRDSSVKYKDANECTSIVTCEYPSTPSCNLSDILKQKETALCSNRALQGRSGMLGSPMGTAQQQNIKDQYDEEYSYCQRQWDLYELEKKEFNQCSSASVIQPNNESNGDLDLKLQLIFNQMCAELNGSGSIYAPSRQIEHDGIPCTPTKEEKSIECQKQDSKSFFSVSKNSCICNVGYLLNKNGKCVTPTDWCAGTLGPKAYIKDNTCHCEDGFTLNSDSTECVKKEQPVITPSPAPIIQPLIKKEVVSKPNVDIKNNQSTEKPTITNSQNNLDLHLPPEIIPKKIPWYKRLWDWFL